MLVLYIHKNWSWLITVAKDIPAAAGARPSASILLATKLHDFLAIMDFKTFIQRSQTHDI